LTFFALSLGLSGCISYSFTGASIPPEMKTVTVNYFVNQAPLFQSNLSQTFTEKLKDRILSQSSLVLANTNGDAVFEGEITNYQVNPTAIQGNETAARNRLTITVHVKFTYNKDPKLNFEYSFTQFEDFNSTESFASKEEELITAIVDKLTEDIFNKAFANW
jgi:hypothetical protein